MSITIINFKTTLIIGEEYVPLLSELVLGDQNSQDGVNKGFIFKLNRGSEDPPVTVYLGDVINFIETKLGAGVGSLSKNPNMGLITQIFPGLDAQNFNSANQTMINIYEFSLNSSTNEFLFSFNMDVESSDPSQGIIPLPAEFAGWLSIQSFAISFSATSTSNT